MNYALPELISNQKPFPFPPAMPIILIRKTNPYGETPSCGVLSS